MHVGHLRSTIQGDSICRIFEFLGYQVDRVNHVGDWGTQFGMLIAELDDNFPDFVNQPPNITDLQTFYQNAKKRFDEEPEFKPCAQQNVVKLQSGDEHCIQGWKMLCQLSRVEFQKIYDRLNIKITEVGESFYNPMLKDVVDDLIAREIAQESKGAICVFVPKHNVPLMVKKSDGGFNYDTTDMAAIRYRVNEVKADRVIYVTDIGQELHFKLVFKGAEKAGYVDPKKTRLDHMVFGMVQQETITVDDKGKEVKKIEKIKTREGKSVKLAELLDEAKMRALKLFEERMQSDQGDKKVQVDPAKLEETAEKMGISAIKYFDLKQNRVQNYVFNFDKMLDPRGDTGVYLLYMYVRINSIIEKSKFGQPEELEKIRAENHGFKISHDSERDLALAFLRLPEQLELAVSEL